MVILQLLEMKLLILCTLSKSLESDQSGETLVKKDVGLMLRSIKDIVVLKFFVRAVGM